MITPQQGLDAERRIREREAEAAATVRAALREADPYARAAAQKLATVRGHEGWAAFEREVLTRAEQARAAYQTRLVQLAEVKIGAPLAENTVKLWVEMAGLRATVEALEAVRGLIPAEAGAGA